MFKFSAISTHPFFILFNIFIKKSFYVKIQKSLTITKQLPIYILGGYLITPHLYFMEDNQIYSIQLLENEGITPSMGGGGQNKTYCPTKREFIDSGFSKSGYDILIGNHGDTINSQYDIEDNQLIPKFAISENQSVFYLNHDSGSTLIKLFPCGEPCYNLVCDGEYDEYGNCNGNETCELSSTVSESLSFYASIDVCSASTGGYPNNYTLTSAVSFYISDSYELNGSEWHDASIEVNGMNNMTETINGKEYVNGDLMVTLPINSTSENIECYLHIAFKNEYGDYEKDYSVYKIIQSKYFEVPNFSQDKLYSRYDYETSENIIYFPKSGGSSSFTISDNDNIGWVLVDYSNNIDGYKINPMSGTGTTTVNFTIPKATVVGSTYYKIAGFYPSQGIIYERQGYYNMPPSAIADWVDMPILANFYRCGYDENGDYILPYSLTDEEYAYYIYQHGLDKPSLSEFPSTMTLPDTKRWESAPNGNMDYLVGSSVTNSDSVEYMVQLPNWCIFRSRDITFHSGGTNCYSRKSSSDFFTLQINPNSYFDKSHYDGDMKLYYKQNNSYYLADTKKIVKCARPSMKTVLDHIPWNPALEAINVKDEDSCGYKLTISGDSNYSAWTFTVDDAQSNIVYYGDKEFDVSIPTNLTDNDIEGYINLHSSYSPNPILESIPFKQECYKLTIYFTGQGFGKDTEITSDYCYLRAVIDSDGYEPGDDDFMYYSFLLSSAYNFTEQSIITTVSLYNDKQENFIMDYLAKLIHGDTMSLYLTDEQGGQGFLKASGTTDAMWEPIWDALGVGVGMTVTSPVSSTAIINTDETPRINAKWDLATAKIINNAASSFTFTVSDSGQTGYKLSCSSWITCQYANGSIYRGTRLMSAFYSGNSGTTERNGFIELMNSAGTVISKCIITQSGAPYTFSYEIIGATKTGNYYIPDKAYFTFNVYSNTDWAISFNGKGWTNDTFSDGFTHNGDISSSFHYNDSGKNDMGILDITINCPKLNITNEIMVGP